MIVFNITPWNDSRMSLNSFLIMSYVHFSYTNTLVSIAASSPSLPLINIRHFVITPDISILLFSGAVCCYYCVCVSLEGVSSGNPLNSVSQCSFPFFAQSLFKFSRLTYYYIHTCVYLALATLSIMSFPIPSPVNFHRRLQSRF